MTLYEDDNYMKKLRRSVPRADVGFPTKWTDSDGVFIEYRKIVAETAIHVPDTMKSWRQ